MGCSKESQGDPSGGLRSNGAEPLEGPSQRCQPFVKRSIVRAFIVVAQRCLGHDRELHQRGLGARALEKVGEGSPAVLSRSRVVEQAGGLIVSENDRVEIESEPEGVEIGLEMTLFN